MLYAKAKASKKCTKDSNEKKESLLLNYWDVNNLHGCAMPQNLPVDGFNWVLNTSQFNKDFMKICNKDKVAGYFLEVDAQYSGKLHDLHNDLPYLLERMKIKKIEKILPNLNDKKEYVEYIKNLKQVLNHELVLKKRIESLSSIKTFG